MKTIAKRRVLRWSVLSGVVFVLLVVACNAWLLLASGSRIFRDAAGLATHDVALVLGTSPRVGGGKNIFFESRMDTAAQLWKDGKVRHLLVSGDNRRTDYDEPTAMQNALVARGVPSDAITRDFAGLRTLDSMVRARQVFGVERLIVITDDWHQPRALFLAQAAGLEAEGACSVDVPWRVSARTRVREWFSRVKAVADIYVLQTKPRHLGEPERLPL